MNAPLTQPIFLRSNSFVSSVGEYFGNEKYKNMRSSLNDRRHTVNKTQIGYRLIHHWHEKGLLPEGSKSSGEWHKFSTIETAWLTAVRAMRDFGLSLEKIALVRQQIMPWNVEDNEYLLFEYYFFEAMVGKSDPYIAVFTDGGADIGTSAQMELGKIAFGSRSVLLISLRAILLELGIQPKALNSFHGLPLTREEIDLLSEIRLGGHSEVKTKVNSKGRVTELELSSVKIDHGSDRELMSRMKEDNLYGKLEIQFENGEKRSVRITKKRRFK